MEKNLVFFKKENEEGVALTSTSANHIANLAKEHIQGIETFLNNLNFYKVDMSLVGSSSCNTIQMGESSEILSQLQSLLEQVSQAKSLIAWLREGIKAKEKLMRECQSISINDWCQQNDIILPKQPSYNPVLTEEEYYNSLSIKERNRFYQLETEAAVLGKYIHPDGHLSNARKQLKDIIQHPHKVDGKGRDALIYTYTPTVNIGEVDNTFFELQKKHREVQAQLNSIKYSCEQAINESTTKVNSDYMDALRKYESEIKPIYALFKKYKEEKSQEYSRLKIVIPNSLLGIFNIVNSLGK